MDNRKNMRLPITVKCIIRKSGDTGSGGETRNISFGGIQAVLRENNSLKPGDLCDIDLFLDDAESVKMSFECRVIHSGLHEVGLSFISIDGIDSYDHFKNMMLFNSPDQELLIAELKMNPGLIVQK